MTQTAKEIGGNVSDELKEAVAHLHSSVGFKPDGFARAIMGRTKLISVDFFADSDPNKKEAVVVSQIVVTEDMCNSWQIMHGGCTATLIDFVTSLPVPVLRRETEWRYSGATLSLNVTYFLPARPGDMLRMTATTKSSGKRAVTVYGEIWSPVGLIASGIHTKMLPAIAKKDVDVS